MQTCLEYIELPVNKNIMLDIRFRRLVVVVGDSGIDAGVLTTLIPFGQQENGSMKSQYSVENCEVIRSLREKMQRVQYQTNVKAKPSLRDRSLFIAWGGGGDRGWRIWG